MREVKGEAGRSGADQSAEAGAGVQNADERADIPAAERPTVKVIDTGGAWFKAMVERVRADKILPLTLCDLELPSQVK